jgi:hypothetical protein
MCSILFFRGIEFSALVSATAPQISNALFLVRYLMVSQFWIARQHAVLCLTHTVQKCTGTGSADVPDVHVLARSTHRSATAALICALLKKASLPNHHEMQSRELGPGQLHGSMLHAYLLPRFCS